MEAAGLVVLFAATCLYYDPPYILLAMAILTLVATQDITRHVVLRLQRCVEPLIPLRPGHSYIGGLVQDCSVNSGDLHQAIDICLFIAKALPESLLISIGSLGANFNQFFFIKINYFLSRKCIRHCSYRLSREYRVVRN